MNTVLCTAYAVNPYKGSEDGTGWNMIRQSARFAKVIAITRKNNKEEIERFFETSTDPLLPQITFYYFDLPKWMRFWKRGPRGSTAYFYLWQLFMPLFILLNGIRFDIAHSLNFHSDSHPTFLWLLGKPTIWGPVGHHPPVPKQYIMEYGRKEFVKDQVYGAIKKTFRTFDPFYRLAVNRCDHIIGINSTVRAAMGADENKFGVLPAVATKAPIYKSMERKGFELITAGRFVPMKGFDIAIRSFARFLKAVPAERLAECKLRIVGSGPEEAFLKSIIAKEGIDDYVELISWIPREELMDLYASSTAFFFPSHEGAGMVVPEALSYGLPVLCFDNAGPGEFVNESCGAKLAYDSYENSINQFAHQLMNWWLNPAELEQLSEGAKAHWQSTFTWERKGKYFENLHRSLLTSSYSTSSDYAKVNDPQIIFNEK